jgi:hypothetical protein
MIRESKNRIGLSPETYAATVARRRAKPMVIAPRGWEIRRNQCTIPPTPAVSTPQQSRRSARSQQCDNSDGGEVEFGWRPVAGFFPPTMRDQRKWGEGGCSRLLWARGYRHGFNATTPPSTQRRPPFSRKPLEGRELIAGATCPWLYDRAIQHGVDGWYAGPTRQRVGRRGRVRAMVEGLGRA